MALAASLFLRQSQSLVMTPQLMQSIQLLQMTHIELNQFIEQEVEKNPLLEIASGDDGAHSHDRNMDDYSAPGDERQHAENMGSDEGFQPDLYETATAGSAGSAPETLDGGLDNVFPDDAGPRAADARGSRGRSSFRPRHGSAVGTGGASPRPRRPSRRSVFELEIRRAATRALFGGGAPS